MAALIALPLGLPPRRRCAWRLQAGGGGGDAAVRAAEEWALGLPTLVFVAMYVTYTVAVRLDLHLLVGVWLVTDATIVLRLPAHRDRHGRPQPGLRRDPCSRPC